MLPVPVAWRKVLPSVPRAVSPERSRVVTLAPSTKRALMLVPSTTLPVTVRLVRAVSVTASILLRLLVPARVRLVMWLSASVMPPVRVTALRATVSAVAPVESCRVTAPPVPANESAVAPVRWLAVRSRLPKPLTTLTEPAWVSTFRAAVPPRR